MGYDNHNGRMEKMLMCSPPITRVTDITDLLASSHHTQNEK